MICLLSVQIKTSYYWLPNVLFGTVSIGVGLLTLLLPETSGHPLPQNLDDVHRIQANQSHGNCCSSASSTAVVQENDDDPKQNMKDTETKKEDEPSATDSLVNNRIPLSDRRDI